MGSLFKTSTPTSMPSLYTPSIAIPNQAAESTPSTAINEDDKAQAESTIRRVSRNRGVGSTILTSFRGVLDDKSPLAPQRKNLLGE